MNSALPFEILEQQNQNTTLMLFNLLRISGSQSPVRQRLRGLIEAAFVVVGTAHPTRRVLQKRWHQLPVCEV
ncbi:hypothetical protein, partial [Candidatus Thiosymbion oneisti]|uniref:hypothetical protein n=1 Tax=Candidatus Thiosymbion oneisti TaxID=589554 RepID=UPI001A9C3F0C